MKNAANVILVIILAIAGWHVIGYFSLSSQQVDNETAQGVVWTAVTEANNSLPRLEAQLDAFMTDRQLVIEKIVEGRQVSVPVNDEINSASADLKRAEATNDLGLAQQATERLNAAINVIIENYPNLSLETAQVRLMDETAGKIHQIAYAQKELIKTQGNYNKTRIYYPLLGGMFPKIEILGAADYNTTELAPSRFDK